MGLFFRHNRTVKRTVSSDAAMSCAIDDLKSPMNETVDQASKDIRKLNALLRANGITLNISIATGGNHHVR